MGGDFGNNGVVKFENILKQLFFLLADSTLFAADIYHHSYFFFGGGFGLLVGVYAAKAQHAVCGEAEQPHDGRKQL